MQDQRILSILRGMNIDHLKGNNCYLCDQISQKRPILASSYKRVCYTESLISRSSIATSWNPTRIWSATQGKLGRMFGSYLESSRMCFKRVILSTLITCDFCLKWNQKQKWQDLISHIWQLTLSYFFFLLRKSFSFH